MTVLVQKYGGTSVANPDRIKAVAQKIKAAKVQEKNLIVIVSAMGDTTDELLSLASQVSNAPPLREVDMLLTAGERISMALLSMALSDLGVQAISLTGSQTGIVTNSSHRRAKIMRIRAERVEQGLAQDKVVIVAGFQGVSEAKEITTLGRGGSDTTAVALAAVFKAVRCEIYTDVNGIYSSDPRKVSGAKLYEKIDYQNVLEMSRRGAQVLHPRCVELARRYGVPLFVLNSLSDPHKNSIGGTQVMEIIDKVESLEVLSVSAAPELALLTLELMRPSVLGALWDQIRSSHWVVLDPVVMNEKVLFYFEREALGEWKKSLEKLCTDGFVKSYEVHEDIVPLAVVGRCFPQDQTVLSEAMAQLEKAEITPALASGTTGVITFGVKLNRMDEAVKLLHAHFIEGINK
jgi:aspartate kinase